MSDPRTRLREAGLAPKKSFGQNFLVAEGVARAIAAACVPDDEVGRARVVEIGAGTGALTVLLAERARSVVAIERDRDLVPVLRDAFAAQPAVQVVEADAQRAALAELFGPKDPASPRVLCGNLPYQITGRLLQLAVEQAASLDRAVFMVQAEVADRLLAQPGTKAYGALTVFTTATFAVSKVLGVTRGAFFPPPQVSSAVISLRAHDLPRARETPVFRALVKRAFEARRKTLRNAWRAIASLEDVARAAEASGISLDARGETLSPEAFARMAAALGEETVSQEG